MKNNLIVIIACSGILQREQIRQNYMLRSMLYGACLSYAESLVAKQDIYTMSLKYGIYPLEKPIFPHLNTSPPRGNLAREYICQQTKTFGIDRKKVIILGATRYANWCKVFWQDAIMPLEGVKNKADRVSWLRRHRGIYPEECFHV